MTGLIEFTSYQAEALLICLAASLAWAGLLLAGARGIERTTLTTSAERLWTAALLFAVLPSLVAPTLAAFGVSLRPAPSDIELGAMELFTPAPALAANDLPDLREPPLFSAEQLIGTAALLYVYGVVLAFFLWAIRQAGLYYAVSRAVPVEDWDLIDRVEEWADRMNVPMPEFKRSRHVSSVCITGVVRQTVLIPDGIEARVGSDDLVLMCAHELAHVRRGDTRLFTATQLTRVLFWFNPLVARIARNAELAAEESADALVLEKGVDRGAYAACFVEGLKFAAFKMNAQPALAPSFTPADPSGRRRRLNAILSPDAPRKAPLAARLMLSAAASTVALVAVGQAALAVDPESAKSRSAILRNLPLVGDVTMGFGEKNEKLNGKDAPAHSGLDIKAPKGAKIVAPGAGVVVEATDRYKGSTAWGKVVVIDHGHGLVTRYAHLDSYAVKKGDRVKAGDVIAAVGATGKVTGPHLHFETLRDGEPVDPADVVAAAPAAIAPVPAVPAVDPVDAVPATPAIPAEPAIEIDPAPVVAPAPEPRSVAKRGATMRFSYTLAPAGDILGAPGVKQFAPPNEFAEFNMSAPVFADAPFGDGDDFDFDGAMEFAFSGDASLDALSKDLEERLLGAANGDFDGSYNLTFRDGDKVRRFSSGEMMTAEKRAELREALKSIRNSRDKAQKEAAKRRDERRREAERMRIEAQRHQAEIAAQHFAMSEEELAEMKREARMSRREQLEAHREALEEARSDIEEQVSAGLEDALSDLDDYEADLQDQDMTREQLAYARASIREQRRQLLRNDEVHKRAIESSRRQIDRDLAHVERMIDEIDDQEDAE